jgi:hypothetical protein
MRSKFYLLYGTIILAYLAFLKQLIAMWSTHNTLVNFHHDINDLDWDIRPCTDNSTASSATKKTHKRFSVFACSIHSSTVAYTFYAPLTAAGWQRVGYKVIVIFVGDFRLAEASSSRLIATRRLLRRMGAIVLNIQCDKSYATKISQLVRVFVGLFPTDLVDDEDGIITTDSDLMPIDNRQYESNINSDGFLINSHCCGNFQRRGKTYRMLAMSHIFLTKKTWRALLLESVQRAELLSLNSSLDLLSSEAPFSFDTINLYAQHEFQLMYNQDMTKGDSAWFMDQILCSMLLTDYRQNHPNLIIEERNLTERLDRDFGILLWNKTSFEQFGDAHLPHDDVFIPYKWDILNNLLRFLFTSSQVNLFNKYYQLYNIVGG